MSKKYSFLMFFSIIFVLLLLIIAILPYIGLFNVSGNVINEEFLASLKVFSLISSYSSIAIPLFPLSCVFAYMYIKRYIASNTPPRISATVLVIFIIISVLIFGGATVRNYRFPPRVETKTLTNKTIEKKLDIEETVIVFILFFLSRTAARNFDGDLEIKVPTFYFDDTRVEIDELEYIEARIGDEYYVVEIENYYYAYPVDEYTLES